MDDLIVTDAEVWEARMAVDYGPITRIDTYGKERYISVECRDGTELAMTGYAWRRTRRRPKAHAIVTQAERGQAQSEGEESAG